MPFMRTDDGPRKLRAVWLGPKGATLPFEWTYVQWALTLCAIPVGAVLLVLVLLLLGAPGWILVVAAVWGGAGGLYGSTKIMKTVSFDEPLRHKKAVFRAEFSRQRRRAERDVSLVWPQPVLGDLNPLSQSLLTPEKDFR